MAGLKVALPIAIAIFFAGLFIASGISSDGGTTTETESQTATTTVAVTGFHLAQTTVYTTATKMDTQTQVSTVTDAVTRVSTVTEASVPKGTPLTIVLVVSCSDCQIGPSSKYAYTGTATNGTTTNQGTTTIQGDGNSSYVFIASPSQIALGSWSIEWNAHLTDHAGALEVKAYFNGVLVSDKSSTNPVYGISDSISVNVY
jgi:hypothetical protein